MCLFLYYALNCFIPDLYLKTISRPHGLHLSYTPGFSSTFIIRKDMYFGQKNWQVHVQASLGKESIFTEYFPIAVMQVSH